MSFRRPSILNRSSTQTLELPTQEDQICGYRAMTRGRYQAARVTRRVFGINNYNITQESAVDPERQLELSRERRANLVPTEVLYSNNRSTLRHRVYQHYSEQRILLHALHRRSAGTNALVVLKDTKWEDSWQIIRTMEVDLSIGTQLVYMFPDMVLSIDDFQNHVEVAIQTHGYDTWQGGESNLLVIMDTIGRLSNTSYMGFQYSVDNIVDHLTTTGITVIPGERRSVEELEGMSWNLKPSEQTTVRVPSRIAMNESINRSLSLQFERYHRSPQPARYSVDQHDREILGNDHLDEDEEHFIGIYLQDPQTQHIPDLPCLQTTLHLLTYTSVSSDSNGPSSWGIPVVNAGEILDMDPYEEVAQQGHAHPLSPAYVPDPIELDEHVPVYVPEPEHPEYHAPSDDDIQIEDLPYVDDASPTAKSPRYIADSDSIEEDTNVDSIDYPDEPEDGKEDDDEDSEEDLEEDHSEEHELEDDDNDDDTDDEDEEPTKDEEEEHLALADSSIVPVVDPIPSARDTEAFETDESAPTPRSP
ncbi:hypothetical protein Tco_0367287 [Tanacetum coccineum]